jgi:aminomethyltransferase
MAVNAGLDLAALQRDYGDIDAEAEACRSSVALFDFSFMHRARIAGPGAADLLRQLTPRPLNGLAEGRIAYALRLDPSGHAIADLTIWRMNDTTFEIFSGRADEIDAVQSWAAGVDATVTHQTAATSIFAVQGPASLRALAGLGAPAILRDLAYFAHAEMVIAGVTCRVGRLGYTGERGFEIVAARADAARLWAALRQVARPAGFAAADMLRIEAGFLLFANELRFPVTPHGLGLQQFAPAEATPPCAQLICFAAECDMRPVLHQPARDDRFPPSPSAILVTSACRSLRAGGVLGLGFIRQDVAGLRDDRGRFRAIRRVALPFFDPAKRRPRGSWRADLWPDDTH